MGWGHLKISTGPISTSLGTDHPWLKGIQVCPNEGNIPSSIGDNNTLNFFLKIFSRTSRQNSIKLNTNYPWMKGIQVIKDQVLFKGGIITKM
jgi:hypothetical protein